MLVVHANWTRGALRMWAESTEPHLQTRSAQADGPEASRAAPAGGAAGPAVATVTAPRRAPHPAAVPAAVLSRILASCCGDDAIAPSVGDETLRLRLPSADGRPRPSERLAGLTGVTGLNGTAEMTLASYAVPCVSVLNEHALAALLALEESAEGASIAYGHALRYWIAVARFVLELLTDQRFIPTLVQSRESELTAAWQPWLHDEAARHRAEALIRSMPPVVRATEDEHAHRPWPILEEALRVLTDATVRRALIAESFVDAVEDRDPGDDQHVAWLAGLLDADRHVAPPGGDAVEMLRDVGRWIAVLDDTGQERPFRLCIRLDDPVEPPADLAACEGVPWTLSLHLASGRDLANLVDVEQVWRDPTGAQIAGGWRLRNIEELVLAELGRAARICPLLESALASETPTSVEIGTGDAYAFLTEHMELLEESGFGVIAPEWWGTPSARLGVRLKVDSPDAPPVDVATAGPGVTGRSLLGLDSLVRYRWQVAIGEQSLSLDDFRELVRQNVALVRLHGRWVEIDREQLREAAALFDEQAGGEISLLEAVQLAHGAAGDRMNLPISGMDATGWVADLLNASTEPERMPRLEQPKAFQGTLRPYQKAGLSWLAFLDRHGLGACLADDMGLGKTIQLIALLLAEREGAARDTIGPTLLIAPTSVISNWVRELARFSPHLAVTVHHGPERAVGEQFLDRALDQDVIITTYTLVSRDAETLKRFDWHRVVLDEAQYIKNPPTKQTATIRALRTNRRVTLTGTPVENRLTELWSIMEFCNPGYLGPAAEFRRRFAIPVERHRDQHRAEQLRNLVRPFVLRRLKTDPNVVSDLPPCVTTKEYATLTTEQAALYERTVQGMLGQVSRAEGIQRRGLVLATLVKLKQICNHPAQLNGEASGTAHGATDGKMSLRSGKVKRLLEMLEEVLATGDKALIFTQFRRMGHLLESMIRSELDADTLFLHGGTAPARRQEMIDRFQDPDGGVPLFILSLKAGGIGVNLTAANHVFHFDRWWNPAVENQATDRAFRIGQTRTVHVHKFVCLGTLEERIDQMIEQKTELAENIIGTGEDWLTGLSTGQLRELLSLRNTAMEGEE